MCLIKTQKHNLVIKLNNFSQFFFFKVALFHLQICTFSFYLSTPCLWSLSNIFASDSDKNEMLTLQMVEIKLGRGPTYLVNKLDIQESSNLAGDFEAFSTVSLSSFLAGNNCLQQL